MLLFLDMETSGLDPRESEILEIAMSEVRRDGKLMNFNAVQVKPTKPVPPDVAAINGYAEEKWTNAISLADAREYFMKWVTTTKKIAVGWNVEFDLRFLDYYICNRKQMNIGYHSMDLMGIGWNKIKHIDKPHLEDLCQALGVPVTDQHTAAGDVKMMIKCYQRLVDDNVL